MQGDTVPQTARKSYDGMKKCIALMNSNYKAAISNYGKSTISKITVKINVRILYLLVLIVCFNKWNLLLIAYLS